MTQGQGRYHNLALHSAPTHICVCRLSSLATRIVASGFQLCVASGFFVLEASRKHGIGITFTYIVAVAVAVAKLGLGHNRAGLTSERVCVERVCGQPRALLAPASQRPDAPHSRRIGSHLAPRRTLPASYTLVAGSRTLVAGSRTLVPAHIPSSLADILSSHTLHTVCTAQARDARTLLLPPLQ